MPFPGSGNAIIYDGFFTGSTSVKVRIQDVTIGDIVTLYNEDSLTELGSAVAASDDVTITIEPLSARRIIAFGSAPGVGTAGGVDVIESNDILTGWMVPVPIDEESVPEAIGLYNPGALHPVTARYDPALINDIPAAYKAAAIELALEPILVDVRVTYRVDPATDNKIAVIAVSSVKNTRGAYTVTIGGVAGDSRTYTVDGTYPVVVTDSEGRTSTKQVNVTPATGYMPVPPAPTVSSIKMYMLTSSFGNGIYFARGDARSTQPLEISYDGVTYEDMSLGGSTSYGSLKNNIPPGSITITIRVKSNTSDFVTDTIPVPYP